MDFDPDVNTIGTVAGGHGQVSGVRCQVSGVRCQVSGVRCQVSGVYQPSDPAGVQVEHPIIEDWHLAPILHVLGG